MRVVFCLNGPDAVNGPNVWLTRHLPLLAARGVEPVVLHLSWASGRRCRFRHALEASSVRVVPVRLGRFVEGNAVAIAEAAAALAPAAFVPNYSVAGYYAARFLREAGVATIGTLHSDDPYYDDILDVFVAGREPWRVSAVVVVSEYLRALVVRRAPRGMPRLHAPYGAPVPARRARWTSDRLRLLYCGRLVEPQKRVRRVAARMMAAARAHPGIEGVLYGDGPERERLAEVLAASGGRVRLGGSLKPGAVQAKMHGAHAFVLLSDFEGLSIALMEAMACGLVPIVTPMRSGVADLVENEVNGLIVPPDDEAAFTEAVTRLARDPGQWRRLSEAARRTVIDRGLTDHRCADAWADFLREIAGTPAPVRALEIPPWSQWGLPERSTRPTGIRLEDRRSAWSAIAAARAAGRPLLLWGAGVAGKAFLEVARVQGILVDGFVDSDPAKQGRRRFGLPVHTPERLRAMLASPRRPFVAVTSQFEEEITATLVRLGAREDGDFVSG